MGFKNKMAGFGNIPPPPPYTGAANTQPFVTPVQQIELNVSCRNLLDMDLFSKSDPFVVVYMQSQDKQWREIGRTETIMDNLNLDFVKSFKVDYFFEEQQLLKFEVYDWDEDTHDITQHDFLGKCITSLGAIVGESNGRVEHPLQVATAKDH